MTVCGYLNTLMLNIVSQSASNICDDDNAEISLGCGTGQPPLKSKCDFLRIGSPNWGVIWHNLVPVLKHFQVGI